jgi:ATP-dependent exoDNAse (exonuclease V) beta subunit
VSDLEFDEAAQFFDRLAGLAAERRLPSRATLTRAMSQLRARDTTSDAGAVILTTIHKAKGLEFDVVIIPATGKTVMRDSHRLLEWTEIVWPDNETALLFAPIPEPGNSVASERAWSDLIRKRERLEQALETRRLLYVALTRARREVHLFGTVPEGAEPPADSLLRLLWPVVADAFAQATVGAAAAGTAEVRSGSTRLLRLDADWRAPEPLPGLPVPAAVAQSLTTPVEYSWAGIKAKHVGTIIHECLRLIGADGVEQWSRDRLDGMRAPLLRRARGLGIVGAACDEAIDLVISALEGAIEDPRGRWVLSGRHRDAVTELRVSGMAGERLVQAVIDRSFIDDADQIRWIIDYKTSTHTGGALDAFLDSECERYRAQLERYAALVSATSREPIRLGLYFPLLRQWREWPFAAGR